MDIQRVRNLTTSRLHTDMMHVYEDLEYITGVSDIMTHQIPSILEGIKPWLRERILYVRFWDGAYDPSHVGEIELRQMTNDERRAFGFNYVRSTDMELRMDELMAYAAKKEAAVKAREEMQQLQNKFYNAHDNGPASVLKVAVQGKTKEEVQRLAMQLPAFPSHLFDFLSDYGFVTGSTVYGDIDQAKDVDWMIEYMPQLTYIMTPYVVSYDYGDNYEAAPGRLSVLYGNIEQRKLLNIIVANDYGLFKAWKYATERMRDLKLNDTTSHLMRNKYARVRLFRAFVDAYDSRNTEIRELAHYDKPDSVATALQYNTCIVCGREAIWFTEKAREAEYHATGVCERCQDV